MEIGVITDSCTCAAFVYFGGFQCYCDPNLLLLDGRTYDDGCGCQDIDGDGNSYYALAM